ncbi:hypothetical protein GALMADRAFT_920376 [Galerina marginata CBS 339.88]|uniref:Uncharacterized protein n=1 Tax=Galerina marginata (strain CBS 339.88) TaxID=685588 RepID=A0A067SES4_GALM3|nr:hypothetical protein GALMADRAFT_920376 [Galerina marginata CBS 339.88]
MLLVRLIMPQAAHLLTQAPIVAPFCSQIPLSDLSTRIYPHPRLSISPITLHLALFGPYSYAHYIAAQSKRDIRS